VALFRLLLLAAAAVALWPEASLRVENGARGEVARFPVADGERFSVTWVHSMYGAPVTDEFEVRGARIALRAVESPSAAALEYLGLTGAGDRQEMARLLQALAYRVAMGEPQRLRVGGAERSFAELGGRGDRLELRVVRRPWLARFLP